MSTDGKDEGRAGIAPPEVTRGLRFTISYFKFSQDDGQVSLSALQFTSQLWGSPLGRVKSMLIAMPSHIHPVSRQESLSGEIFVSNNQTARLLLRLLLEITLQSEGAVRSGKACPGS